MTDDELLRNIDELKATMIAVATGGPRIQNVQADFARTHDDVSAELRSRHIDFDLPFRDLWLWYGRWTEGDLGSYSLRREFVARTFEPLIRRIKQGVGRSLELTGWERVDRALPEAHRLLAAASNEEQFQAVGLLCREILISLGQAVFDASRHPTLDGKEASSTDAKRMLEAFIHSVLDHDANEYVRKHARAALDLAVNLQHKRTATYRDTAICLEATASVVNLVAIVAGRRTRGE